MTLWAWATLYFTGSDHFNRSMRFWAKRNGLSLSDKGLTMAVRNGNDKVSVSRSVYCATEEDIFEHLGLEYVPPHERNCFDYFDTKLQTKSGEAIQLGEIQDKQLTDSDEEEKRIVSLSSQRLDSPRSAVKDERLSRNSLEDSSSWSAQSHREPMVKSEPISSITKAAPKRSHWKGRGRGKWSKQPSQTSTSAMISADGWAQGGSSGWVEADEWKNQGSRP